MIKRQLNKMRVKVKENCNFITSPFLIIDISIILINVK